MDELEKILQKANELGHLLARSEVVQRFREMAEKVNRSEPATALLDEHAQAVNALLEKQAAGQTIEPDEERAVGELEQKLRDDPLIREFLASQAYYAHLMRQVEELIARPRGEPPPQSDIIVPGQGGSSRIIIP